MNVKELFTDDSAVSPVIGVILMVAITIILAAVIGAFVLNLGATQATAPTATWEWSQGDFTGNADTEVRLTHGGGDKVDNSNLDLEITDVSASDATNKFSDNAPSEWTAGSQAVVANDLDDGDKLDLIWKSPKGSDSQIIGEYTVN